MRPIDADACPKLFDEEFKKTRQLILSGEDHLDNLAEGFFGADNVIRKMPTISPDSLRPKGRWEDRFGGKYENKLYECSVCHQNALYKTEYDMLFRNGIVQVLTDFCPNCGADMRED